MMLKIKIAIQYLSKMIRYFQSVLLFLFCYLLINFNFLFAQELSNPDKKPETIENQEKKSTVKSRKKGINLAWMPIIMYQPETSLIFGGGTAITIRKQNEKDDVRPNNINAYAIYTLNNQTVINILPDFYFDEENWELKSAIAYQKFPDTFYGIGNNTSTDDAEDFTTEDILIQPWLLYRLYKNFRIGMLYNFMKTSVLEIEKNGLLSMRTLRGIDGSLLSGSGPVLDWDTRDNIFYPSKGSWFQFYCTFYRSWLGSEFEYESYTIDLRHYFSLSSAHIVAVQIFGISLNGEITFNEYARMFYLRGIHGSRFRDLKMGSAQIEYRYPIYKRFSGVVFSSVGDVMNKINEFKIKEVKYTIGPGLRFAVNPEEKINLRLDIGISSYGIYPYLQLSEAF